jgi:hypothetical protein
MQVAKGRFRFEKRCGRAEARGAAAGFHSLSSLLAPDVLRHFPEH